MAFQQAFTDPGGGEHPAGYWKTAGVYLVDSERHAAGVFYAYHDATFRMNDRPVGGVEKRYDVYSDDYDSLKAAALAPGGPNVYALVYAHALAVKDTLKAGYTIDRTLNPPTYHDAGGNVVAAADALESFFEHASEV